MTLLVPGHFVHSETACVLEIDAKDDVESDSFSLRVWNRFHYGFIH